MVTIFEMAEAHLLNVEREVKALYERKAQMDAEIKRLSDYMKEGAAALQEAKTEKMPSTDHSTIFDPKVHSSS